MARQTFGGRVEDYVYYVTPSGVMTVPPSGTLVTFWTAATGGTQITDIQTVAGVAISPAQLAPNSLGLLPAFLGPDSAGAFAANAAWMYADAGAGSRYLIQAQGLSNAGSGVAPAAPSYSATPRSGLVSADIGYNFKPANTRRWRSGLGKVLAGTGGMDVAIIGDSLSAVATNQAGNVYTAGAPSWPSFLRQSISGLPAASVTDGQVRMLIGTYIDSRWAFTGTWNGGIPSITYSTAINSTATYTAASGTFTNCAVWYYDDNTGSAFTISVNGASSGAGFTTVTNNTGTGWKKVTLSGFTAANNFQIKYTVAGSGGLAVWAGGAMWNSNTLVWHNLAQPGSTASGSGTGAWVDNTSNNAPGKVYIAPHVLAVANGGTDPDVVFIALGANDLQSQTVATTKAAVNTIAGEFPNSDVILVATQPLAPAYITDANWTSYVSSLYDLADSLNVPLIDIRSLVGTYANAQSSGWTTDGQGHFVNAGNAMLARAIYRCLP